MRDLSICAIANIVAAERSLPVPLEQLGLRTCASQSRTTPHWQVCGRATAVPSRVDMTPSIADKSPRPVRRMSRWWGEPRRHLMAGSQVTAYAAELRTQLAALGVDVALLDELIGAAQALADALDAPDATL